MAKKLLLLFLSLVIFISQSFATGIGAGDTTASCDNETLGQTSGTANIEVDWVPNTIAIRWYDGDTRLSVQSTAQSCVYDDDLYLPNTQPTKTGYTFKGWEVKYAIPAEYTELEYLDGNAGPYINTRVLGNNNLRIVVKFNVLSFGGREYYGTYYDGVLGNYAGENVNMWRILLSANQATCTVSGSACNLRITGYANAIPGGGPLFSAFTIELNQDYIVDFSQTEAFVNGQVQKLLTGDSQGSTGTSSIKLFAGGANGGNNYYSNTRIYYFLLYDGDNLVRNMIPARRNSDNVVGMWDTISGTFFTNAGRGSFIAGPAVQ
jgi:hypothetical protein